MHISHVIQLPKPFVIRLLSSKHFGNVKLVTQPQLYDDEISTRVLFHTPRTFMIKTTIKQR